jgi:hypothetical protein
VLDDALGGVTPAPDNVVAAVLPVPPALPALPVATVPLPAVLPVLPALPLFPAGPGPLEEMAAVSAGPLVGLPFVEFGARDSVPALETATGRSRVFVVGEFAFASASISGGAGEAWTTTVSMTSVPAGILWEMPAEH